jgi:hypothetical protein
MNMRLQKAFLVLAMLAWLSAVVETGVAQMKSVQTRIGKMDLNNGFPTDETYQKVYFEMDFQRACQAYLWALPAVEFQSVHLAQLNTLKVEDGEVGLYVDAKDKAGMLTPDLSTAYGFSFWNLKEKGPLVVEVPAGGTAGQVLDVWQRPVTETGQSGPDKGHGGKYLILPLGSAEMKADGYVVVHSPTNQVWFLAQGISGDAKEAETVVQKYRLYSWSQKASPPATKFTPVAGKPWNSAQPADMEYWVRLNNVLQPEAMEARDGFFMAMLAPLGIEKGRAFLPNEYQKRVLSDAAIVGDLMARTNAYVKRSPGSVVWPGKHWQFANQVELAQQTDKYAQLDERAIWFYEAIGNSLEWHGKTLGFGQVLLETQRDATGGYLSGSKNYHLRIPPNAPVKQFWSITLYDPDTRGVVMAEKGPAELTSRQQVQANPDGSVDLYIGPQAPQGKEANWVATVAGKGFFCYFRLYGPTGDYFNKNWRLGDLEAVQ